MATTGAVTAEELVAKATAYSKQKEIEVPEWGCTLKVRELTRGEAREFIDRELTPRQIEEFVLVRAVVDPPISEEQAKELLAGASFSTTQRVLIGIAELSGLTAGFRPAAEDSDGSGG